MSINKYFITFLVASCQLLMTCSLFYTTTSFGQVNGQPPIGASCVVSVGNRNAPLAADGSYVISNIPGDMGAIRARATCSDGSLGQSEIGFTDTTRSITIPLGPIDFSRYDPVPIAATLSANESQIGSGNSSQLTMSAISLDGTIRDVTNRSEGTTYAISNGLLATITNDGLVTITGQFDTASSARVVASATTEGSVSSTFMYTLGPRGTLIGTIFYADGVTPVQFAQVSVLRLQPMEIAGTATTNSEGQFELQDVNAGSFIISVLDPVTGDRALSAAQIETQAEIVEVSINLNGQGRVNVTVRNDNDELVSGSDVTLTALGSYVDVRTAQSNSSGVVVFENVTAGDFTVSTRDSNTGLLGAIVSNIQPGEIIDVTLRLQESGIIQGRVYDVDGTTLLSGVQVRVLSRQRGIVSQIVTGVDGSFSFDNLPKSDGPFILDAFVDGRLRGRVPGIVYSQGDETLEQDVVLSAVGTVSGIVKDGNDVPFVNAVVTMQSLDGLGLSFDAETDKNGRYVLQAVPVGDFELTALTVDGQTTRDSGRVGFDGDNVVLDLTVAGNTIVGTVFERDGITPVGQGVTVYLAPRSEGEFYSYSTVDEAISTVTNVDGKYGFSVTEAGDFYVQAEQNLDRGRSRAILVNLDPSQPLETNVVFLAKGSVNGVVTDANGVIQSNLTVSVFTEGAFNVTRTTITNNLGQYDLDGVFAGSIVVSVQNTLTGQSGIRQARLDAEGQQVTIDVVLSASGSVSGQIFKANGEISDQPIKLTVLSNGIELVNLNLNNGQFYQVIYVPLGDVEIIAEELNTGNKGIAITRLDSLNENKEVNVSLIGQGQLLIELLDEDNQPVEGALVTTTTRLPFRSNQEGVSDSNGFVLFDQVLAGDFLVSAIKDVPFGSLQGGYSGTMLPDDLQEVTIQMETTAVGSISGVVYKSDGITPQGAGWVVRMLPEPYQDAYITYTNANGEYHFDQVNAGSYNIDVYAFFDTDRLQCPIRGRILARASGVSVSIQDELVEADLQFIGAGEVFGVITDNIGNPAPSINITLTSPDPIFGLNSTCSGRTTYETTTNSNGEYRLSDIPAGNFTLLAENSDLTLRAQDNDRIRFDTDVVEMNLSLIDNVITLPYDFYDANGFLYDINGDGSIGTGTRGVFASAAPDNAGMRLEIVTNDIPVPFVNGDGTLGRLIAEGQELEVDDTTASGLFVSRRIFTPRSGYFSRYLEVLENPTDTPITVDVRIKSHHRNDDSNPRVVDTSDGDQVLSVSNPALPDRWVVIDDQTDADPFENNSIPATGHVFDGLGALTQVSSASYELIGQTGRLIYQWDDITIEPGQEVILMHFIFGQIKRTGSRQAANRLMNLPPEAIDDLTTDDREAILNFDVPNQSLLEQLPNLSAGQLSGRVLSGNGVTTIPNAKVEFESQHPLFGRIRYVQSNSDGEFEFLSTLDGTINNYVIPVHGFNLSASYQPSGASSAITPGSFPIDVSQAIQDIIFIGKGDVQGSVLRHNGATVPNTSIVMCELDNRSACFNRPDNRTVSNEDGSYILYANTPRDYFIYADKAHPQSFYRNIHGDATVTASPSDVSVVNIILEETGSISGTIRAADGTPVSEAEITLWDISNGSVGVIRRTYSDTAGFYRFFDVPLGSFEVRAKDVISNATGLATTSVTVDQESNADVNLLSTATLNVTVQYERGVLANGSTVILTGPSGEMRVTSDSNGLAQFQVFTGEFNLLAQHPDRAGPLTVTGTVEVLESDDVVGVTLILPGAGEISGTIRRPDGTTLAGGFPYSLTQIRGPSIGRVIGDTDNIGFYSIVGLPIGDYVITAFDSEQDRFADSEFSIVVDGEELLVDLTLLDERIALPADLFDANRFIFDVQQDGSLQSGSNAFSNGAAKLLINGQAFTGDTSARLQAGRRQFAVSQDTSIFGLDVTRKIYVPRGAYFARYIEVLDNPTNADITVDVMLTHGMEVGEFIQTSTNDIELSLQDHWFLIDDDLDQDVKLFGDQMPPVAHLFTDESMTLSPTILDISYTSLMANVQQQWSEITIPAGQRVSLMHVAIQQVNRAGAEYAANRLSQLPPELLNDMTVSDYETIINFDLPIDGVSQLESLPPLTGNISGAVFEGSDSNPVPVPSTRITVQSMHPLFSRVWGKRSDVNGCPGPGTVLSGLLSSANDATFTLQGQLTDVDSIAIPAGVDLRVVAQEAGICYMQESGHPFTNVPSRVSMLEASGNQNVIFDTSVVTGTVTGSVGFSVTGGRLYRSIDDPDSPFNTYVPIDSNGSYLYPGLVPGDYDLLFDTNHPDRYGNNDNLRGSRVGISVPFREVFVSDVLLQPTGRVQGTVLAFDSSPSVNAEIILISEEQNQDYNQCESGCDINTLEKHKGMKRVSRSVITDSQGLYNFSAIPTGTYSMQVTDPVSGGVSNVELTVIENQVTVQNVVLTAVGSATITVNDSSNNPVIDSFVYINSASDGGEEVAGRTDFLGQLVVANIPIGNYDIRVSDPRAPSIRYMDRSVSGNIATQGQANSHTLNMRAAAQVQVSVINSDDAGNPVANADVSIADAIGNRNVGRTNATGTLLIPVVPEGGFNITVSTSQNGNINLESVSGIVESNNDNLQIDVLVDLRSNVVALPINIRDANNQLYQIRGEEGSDNLPKLLIDGVAFESNQEAITQLDERQFLLSSNLPLSGLEVTRKMYVPTNGYFVRYIEMLNNPTQATISVDLEINSSISSQIVLDSSNGDNSIDNGTIQDLWFTSGYNGNSSNNHAFVTSGENAFLAPPELSFTTVGTNRRSASAYWSSITIPANSRVQIIHFYSPQSFTESATASAQRLVGLPQESLIGLITNDVSEILNFNVPIDLVSQLEDLPDLTGTISGHVFQGDGITPIENAYVKVKSNHLLFNNTYEYSYDDLPTLETDENGLYSITGDLTGGDLPIAIPLDGTFTLSSYHSNSGLDVEADVVFGSGETSVSQDLVFATGSIQGIVSGAFRPNSDFIDDVFVIQNGSILTLDEANLDGSFNINGLASGNYLLESRTGDYQGRLVGSVDAVAVTEGNTTSQNIVYPANGAIGGQVFSNTGIEQPNQMVELTQSDSSFLRSVMTNASGEFEFGAVPVGNYLLTAINSDTQSGITQSVSISDNQLSQQDLILLGTGTVTINLLYKAGGVVANHAIYIESPSINERNYLGHTDASGTLIAEISEGPYTLIAIRPLTGQEGSVDGVVQFADEVSSIDLILPVSANIQFHVTNRDNANAPMPGVKIRITDVNDPGNTGNATTAINGFDTINNVIQATYLAFVEVDNNYESSFLIDVTENDDGITLDKEISFAESQHIMSDFNFGQETHLYQIPLLTGQTLSLSLRHIREVFSCNVTMNVYDPTNTLIARGVGGNTSQSNQLARIDQLPVLIDGRYTLEISPFSATCFSGSYRLNASIDGQSIGIESYQDGGQVSGTLFEADGITTISEETVRLTTNGPGPIFNQQLQSDASGNYSFEGVPVGDFELIYVPRPSVSETGTITTAGEQVVQDLILSQTTILDIRVLNADGTPIDRQARLDINAIGQTRFRPFTNQQGEYTYSYFGFEELSIGVSSPYNSQIIAHQFVQPSDGETIIVNLLLTPGVVQGVIYDADGVTSVGNTTVSAYYASNDKFIKNDFANAQGEYQFDYLPIDNEIVFKVRDPRNDIETQVTFLTTSQGVNLDINLLGTGNVYGRLLGIGDAPRIFTGIRAEYLRDVNDINSDTSQYTQTNGDGEFSFSGLPIGRTLTIRYEEFTSYGEVDISEQTTLINQGDSNEVNLYIPGSGITFQLLTADGVPIEGDCYFRLRLQFHSPSTIYGVECGALVSFIGIPESFDGSGNQATIEVFESKGDQLYSGSYLIPDNQLLEEFKMFSVIKGTVSYFDSMIAPYAYIQAFDKYTSADENGFYRLVGLDEGAFRISVSDNLSSLQTNVDGTIDNEEIPIDLDIQFPASGTINGNILDVDGTLMPDIDVFATSSNSLSVVQSTTNINGFYEMNNVVVGDIELSAVNQVTKNIATELVTLTSDKEIQTHDIQFLAPGSVSGIVNDELNFAVADACVNMQYINAGPVYQGLNFSTTSDANGIFSFDSAASGKVLVVAQDECFGATLAGLEQTEIFNNTNSDQVLQFGNAEPLIHEINQNGTNFSFEIYRNGNVQSKYVNSSSFLNNSSFIQPLSLNVNNISMNSQPAALSDISQQGLLIGPTATNTLSITRKVYAPESGNYIRIIDSITNKDSVSVDVQVGLQGTYGIDDYEYHRESFVILEVDPSSNEDRYAMHRYLRNINTGEPFGISDYPAVTAYVMASNNVLLPANTDFQTGRSRFSWDWSTTLLAGETVSFLSYVVVNKSEENDVLTVTNIVNEILDGTQMDMFNGLTIDERTSIVNFEVPQL